MVKLWIHSSVAFFEAFKSESGMKTKCYKYKKITIEVLLEWFLTTRMAATSPRISIFTLSLLKIRAYFYMVPNVCFLISQRWKKIMTNGFQHCKLHSKKRLSLEYEQYRTKIGYWKIVANEKCTAEIGELSSVKKLLWADHKRQKDRKSLKWRRWDGLMSLKQWIDYVPSFWRTKEKMAKNRPKKPKIVKNRSFSLIS